MGISQPPKSASLAPRATCRSWIGECRKSHVSHERRRYRCAAEALGSLRRVTTLTLRPASPPSIPADALIVGVAQGGRGLVVVADSETTKALSWLKTSLIAVGAKGDKGEVVRVPAPPGSAAPLVVAVGLGAGARTYDPELVRRAVGAATRSLVGLRTAVVALPIGGATDAGALAEGALLGAYAFRSYRHASTDDHPPALRTVVLAGPATAERAVKAAVSRAKAVAEGVGRARDLVNTPAGDLHPAELAAEAVQLAEAAGLEVQVLDERALKRGGYGGILGVGQGSTHRPVSSGSPTGRRGRGATSRSSARASPSTRAACPSSRRWAWSG